MINTIKYNMKPILIGCLIGFLGGFSREKVVEFSEVKFEKAVTRKQNNMDYNLRFEGELEFKINSPDISKILQENQEVYVAYQEGYSSSNENLDRDRKKDPSSKRFKGYHFITAVPAY